MEFLHCNSSTCGDSPHFGAPPKKYFLTSCGHVLCEVCQRKGGGVTCVCGVSCNFVELGANTKPEHKLFFMDPLEVMTQKMNPFVKVVKFQKTQAKSFVRIYGKLKEQVNSMKSEVEQLKAQKAELTAKLNDLESREQSWIGNGSGRGGGLICSPATPANNGFFVQQSQDSGLSSLFGPPTSLSGSASSGFSEPQVQAHGIGSSVPSGFSGYQTQTPDPRSSFPQGFSGSQVRTPGSGSSFEPSTPRSGGSASGRSEFLITPASTERITRPIPPIDRSERFPNRFSPAMSSSSGIGRSGGSISSGSSRSSTPAIATNNSRLSGLGLNRQQPISQFQRAESQNQRHRPSSVRGTPDILDRLKNLRW